MGLLKWVLELTQEKGRKGTVDYNAHKMRRKYPLNEQGYFGKKGKSKGKPGQKQVVRVIESENQYKTAKDFYSKISKRGKESLLPNGRGKRKDLSDKTAIVYREKTGTPNSPAVSLNTPKSSKVENQKIHFEKRRR